MRPVFPSAVLNWLPVIVSVVSPVSPRASQLNVPAYVPERSVCSAVGVIVAGVCAGAIVCAGAVVSPGIAGCSPVGVVALTLSRVVFFELRGLAVEFRLVALVVFPVAELVSGSADLGPPAPARHQQLAKKPALSATTLNQTFFCPWIFLPCPFAAQTASIAPFEFSGGFTPGILEGTRILYHSPCQISTLTLRALSALNEVCG